MKPKALILDDLPSRHKMIVKDNPEYEFHSSTDIWDAQEAIANEKFEVVFLDYDLNDYNYDSSIVTEDTTLELTGADFLAYMLTEVPAENWPSRVIIISIDKEGAQECLWILNQIGIKNSWTPLPN